MAPETKAKSRDGEALAEPPPKAPRGRGLLARWLTPTWIAVLVGASIGIHALGFAYYRWAREKPPAKPSPEVSLGQFCFEADREQSGGITAAAFTLHVALLEHVEQAARGRLAAHRFRVQQGIEELLRKAHGGDFDDPDLAELKRQLQEQVNDTLAMKAIADVMITDLKVQRSDAPSRPVANTAAAAPQVEKPSS